MNFQQASKNRQSALKTGNKFYIGRDCKRNHGGIRYAKWRKCYECMLIDSNEWHRENK